jgi:molybdopterin/thiamine biosynthesis adenylyltransferase
MQSCDLFVNGIDFPDDIIFDVNNSAIVTDTPWMNASYKGPCYAVTIFVPSMTPSFRCLLHKIETKKKALGVEEEYLNDNFPAPIIGPVAEIAGSLAAMETIKYVTGQRSSVVGYVYQQNSIDLAKSKLEKLEYWENCPACNRKLHVK